MPNFWRPMADAPLDGTWIKVAVPICDIIRVADLAYDAESATWRDEAGCALELSAPICWRASRIDEPRPTLPPVFSMGTGEIFRPTDRVYTGLLRGSAHIRADGPYSRVDQMKRLREAFARVDAIPPVSPELPMPPLMTAGEEPEVDMEKIRQAAAIACRAEGPLRWWVIPLTYGVLAAALIVVAWRMGWL